MMNTLDEAVALRDKDAPLTDWRYHEVMGVYCRFGDLPISMFQSQGFGGLYMTEIKSGEALRPTKLAGPTYWTTIRIPVGFEIAPGKHPGYEVLGRLMFMTPEVVQDAYEHVMIHGQGMCSSEWSRNRVSWY